MGHALNNTLQDILVRFERMRGKNVLWQPGMDHAGIATQMVVERQLAERQIHRRDIGREEFIDKVWEWKAESGGIIFNQLKRLGASCDWSRERFTMDEGLSKAVLEVFVTLYKQGLIYRGKRLVNWDPKFETAISDLEVENREVDGHMWHFKYPLAGGETYPYVEKDADGNVVFQEERDYIAIATTRPETMLGDGAVAVHPSDERYAPIVGKLCEIPVGPKEHRRLIPIITDEYPDPEFGSGAVKITGAHDFNDYQVARRNGIPLYRLMDTSAAMRDDGEPYAVCAAQALAIAEAGDAAERGRGRRHQSGAGRVSRPRPLRGAQADRRRDQRRGPGRYRQGRGRQRRAATSRTRRSCSPSATARRRHRADADRPVVCRRRDAGQAGDRLGARGPHQLRPEELGEDLFRLDGEHRALVHLAPALVGPPDPGLVRAGRRMSSSRRPRRRRSTPRSQYYLAHEGPWKAWVEEQLENFEPGEILTRDEDVLDTWFSSALWPFSTLGWPDKTPELETYYQTDVLVTGFDIIFFWVARMMMMGLHFMDEEPFHTVYVHALVRDKNGAKMSKSKGNVIDPLELIDEYGADALRFTLTIMAAQGRDVKLDPARIAGYRNFGTKLWNATRFAEMNGVARNDEFWLNDAKLTVNRWILTELTRATREITEGITSYRFNEAAGAAYRFVWNLFCDWYLELLKPVFMGDDEAAKAESQAVAAFVLDEIYKLLHPMMPFMTEELWAHTAGEGGERSTLLCHARWPEPDLRGRRGRSRDQLADRPRLGHPLGALGNERAAGGDRAAGRGRRQRGDARAA